MEWEKLIGKRIVAFRGIKVDKGPVVLSFILFDDGESFLELREQDPYDYHDCNGSARILDLRKSVELWTRMIDKEGFAGPARLGYNPF